MNKADIKRAQDNSRKLSEDGLHFVMGLCLEGLQAFQVLHDKKIQISHTDPREAFDEMAVRAMIVAEEYAKRHKKSYEDVAKMTEKIKVHPKDRYSPEFISLEADMDDISKLVTETELDVNKHYTAGSVANDGVFHENGNRVIRPDSAELAKDILDNPEAHKDRYQQIGIMEKMVSLSQVRR